MKTNRSSQTSSQGSVLIATMGLLALAAIALASYFIIVQAQTASVARSQTWNTTVTIAESGLEEGLALVNQGAPAIQQSAWAWTNSIPTGWSTTTNGAYTLTRTVSGSNTYTVTVDTSSGTPVITSSGNVPFTPIPWLFSSISAEPFLAAGGTSGGNSNIPSTATTTLGRKVQVQTVLSGIFTAAVITKSNFNMNGNNATIDSFDSSSSLYSTAGMYVPAKRKANGNIGTDSSVVGDINIGNGNIYGKVMTGPGTVQTAVQVGSQGAIGDAAWNLSHTGIETGFWSGNFNVSIPDVPTPATGSTLPATVNGVKTLNGGNYTAASDPSVPLIITAPTTLWIQGSYSPSITISNGGSLVLYLGKATGSGDSLSISGNGALNYPGYANNLQFYGLPSLTSISFSGNAGFDGVIYAPEADMSGSGGGHNTLDTSGAMIVKSVTLNGHWNFHYDESLANNGANRGWIAKSWTELKYP